MDDGVDYESLAKRLAEIPPYLKSKSADRLTQSVDENGVRSSQNPPNSHAPTDVNITHSLGSIPTFALKNSTASLSSLRQTSFPVPTRSTTRDKATVDTPSTSSTAAPPLRPLPHHQARVRQASAPSTFPRSHHTPSSSSTHILPKTPATDAAPLLNNLNPNSNSNSNPPYSYSNNPNSSPKRSTITTISIDQSDFGPCATNSVARTTRSRLLSESRKSPEKRLRFPPSSSPSNGDGRNLDSLQQQFGSRENTGNEENRKITMAAAGKMSGDVFRPRPRAHAPADHDHGSFHSPRQAPAAHNVDNTNANTALPSYPRVSIGSSQFSSMHNNNDNSNNNNNNQGRGFQHPTRTGAKQHTTSSIGTSKHRDQQASANSGENLDPRMSTDALLAETRRRSAERRALVQRKLNPQDINTHLAGRTVSASSSSNPWPSPSPSPANKDNGHHDENPHGGPCPPSSHHPSTTSVSHGKESSPPHQKNKQPVYKGNHGVTMEKDARRLSAERGLPPHDGATTTTATTAGTYGGETIASPSAAGSDEATEATEDRARRCMLQGGQYVPQQQHQEDTGSWLNRGRQTGYSPRGSITSPRYDYANGEQENGKRLHTAASTAHSRTQQDTNEVHPGLSHTTPGATAPQSRERGGENGSGRKNRARRNEPQDYDDSNVAAGSDDEQHEREEESVTSESTPITHSRGTQLWKKRADNNSSAVGERKGGEAVGTNYSDYHSRATAEFGTGPERSNITSTVKIPPSLRENAEKTLSSPASINKQKEAGEKLGKEKVVVVEKDGAAAVWRRKECGGDAVLWDSAEVCTRSAEDGMKALFEKEGMIQKLQNSLRIQADEFSQLMIARQKEVENAKQRECVALARHEAMLRQKESTEKKVEDLVRKKTTIEMEIERLKEVNQAQVKENNQLNEDLKDARHINTALELSEKMQDQLREEMTSLKDIIAEKDYKIAQFQEESMHRPKHYMQRRPEAGFPSMAIQERSKDLTSSGTQTEGDERRFLDDNALAKRLEYAEGEAKWLRTQLVELEKKQLASLPDIVSHSSHLASHDGLEGDLRKEVDALRVSTVAASARERDAERVACEALDDLKKSQIELKKTQKELQDAHKSYQEAQAKISSLEHDKAKHEKSVKNVKDRDSEEVMSLRDRIEELIRAKTHLESDQRAHERTISLLEEQSSTLEEAVRDLKQDKTRLMKAAKEEAEEAQKVEKMKHRIEEKTVELETMKMDLEASLARARNLEAEKEGLQASLDNMIGRMSELEKECARLEEKHEREDQRARVEHERNAHTQESRAYAKETENEKLAYLLETEEERVEKLAGLLKKEGEKVEKLRDEVRMTVKEKMDIAATKRDLELTVTDLQWHLKARDLEKLQFEEARERGERELRMKIDTLEKEMQRSSEEKMKSLEEEKRKSERLTDQLAQETDRFRKSLQKGQESGEATSQKRTIRNLEKENASLGEELESSSKELFGLRRRIEQVEQERDVAEAEKNKLAEQSAAAERRKGSILHSHAALWRHGVSSKSPRSVPGRASRAYDHDEHSSSSHRRRSYVKEMVEKIERPRSANSRAAARPTHYHHDNESSRPLSPLGTPSVGILGQGSAGRRERRGTPSRGSRDAAFYQPHREHRDRERDQHYAPETPLTGKSSSSFEAEVLNTSILNRSINDPLFSRSLSTRRTSGEEGLSKRSEDVRSHALMNSRDLGTLRRSNTGGLESLTRSDGMSVLKSKDTSVNTPSQRSLRALGSMRGGVRRRRDDNCGYNSDSSSSANSLERLVAASDPFKSR